MFRRITMFVAGVSLLVSLVPAAPAAAGEPLRWLNVNVVETKSAAKVRVRVPITLARTVLAAVHTDEFDGGKLQVDLGDAKVDWVQLFTAVREAPDGDYVTVESPDANVTVSKKGGLVEVHVEETKTSPPQRVDVTIPTALLDVLRVDDQGRLDLDALLARMAELPDGEVVRVTAPDANVRVWID